MQYGLGVDLGTTQTAAAVRGADGRVEVVRLGGRRAEIPSLVFVKPDGELLIGEAAERRGQAEPARLAREFKRRIGDPVPILVGGTPFSAHALTAKLLRHVLDTVIRLQDGPPAAITLTHPANWGPYKREQLDQAIRLADAGPVQVRSEPEAAALQHATARQIASGETVVVYDLGGGTFDVAVLRRVGDGFALLGEPEGIEQLGGIDFDEAVFGHVIGVLGAAADGLDPSDAEAVAALTRLRRDCVEAKESLSFDTETMIPVALPGLHTRVRLNRSELESMIAPSLADTVTATQRAMRSAGVRADEVSAILLAGGSSRIPLVAQLLSTEFQRPVIADPHPEHSIAMGAAVATAGALGGGSPFATAPPPRPVGGSPQEPPTGGYSPVATPRRGGAAVPVSGAGVPVGGAGVPVSGAGVPVSGAGVPVGGAAGVGGGGGVNGAAAAGGAIPGQPAGPAPGGYAATPGTPPPGGYAATPGTPPPVSPGRGSVPVSPGRAAGPVSYSRGAASIPGSVAGDVPVSGGPALYSGTSYPGTAPTSGAAPYAGTAPTSATPFPGAAPTSGPGVAPTSGPGVASFSGSAPASGAGVASFPGGAPASGAGYSGAGYSGAPPVGAPPQPGSGRPWPPPEPPTPDRRSTRKIVIASAAAGVILIAGGTAVALAMNRDNSKPQGGGAPNPAVSSAGPATSDPAAAPAMPSDTMLVRVDTGADSSQERVSKIYSFTPGPDAQNAPRTPLKGTEDGDTLPKWSHDREQIALTNIRGQGIDVYVMKEDGSKRRRILNDVANARVAWSIDDTKIAYVRKVDGVNQIFIKPVDGGSPRQLTRGSDLKDDPTWSADGDSIIYWRVVDDVRQIFELNIDNPDEPGRVIVNAENGPANDPMPSPDGSKVLYSRETGPANAPTSSDIWIIDADGKNPRQLTSNPEREMDPTWSPDGTWFAFVRGKYERPTVIAMRPDGNGETLLTKPGTREGHPCWF